MIGKYKSVDAFINLPGSRIHLVVLPNEAHARHPGDCGDSIASTSYAKARPSAW